MNAGLTEQEMRNALGLEPTVQDVPKEPEQILAPALVATPRPKNRVLPRLRVTLRVTREFEGEETLFVHDASTLSRFDAEQSARRLAAQEKYRFFELVSIVSID